MTIKQTDIALVFPPIRTWDHPRNFPAGIALLAARLRRHGFHVAVIDANGRRLTLAQTLAELRALQPAVIGIGGLITTYAWIKSLTTQLKQHLPHTPIVLGGGVATGIVETALRRLPVDILALGEADDTILELLPALLNGDSYDNIPGLAFLRDNRVLRTPDRPLIDNLDTLPLPAWDLFPMDVYLAYPVVGIGRDIDIISSRGCPSNCRYCYRIFGRRYRGRSAEHVLAEMQTLRCNYNVDFISFQDDCFVIDKKRVYTLCDLIDRNPHLRRIRWSCTGRVGVCDPPLLRRMRRSGCVSVSYGLESGSQTILDAMGKGVTLAQTRAAVNATRAAGMRCPVSFMIGYPGETPQTIRQTVDFCIDLQIPLTSLMFTCPYPGTPLYQQMLAENKLTEDEEQFVLRLGDAVDFAVNLTDISDKELLRLRDDALAQIRDQVPPPDPLLFEQQQRRLYGDELWDRAAHQRQAQRLKQHRLRHGFNEGDAEFRCPQTKGIGHV